MEKRKHPKSSTCRVCAPGRFRRWIQFACLLLYLTLFFYVCWPYGARPVQPQLLSAGWRLDELNQATGNIRLRGDNTPDAAELTKGQTVYVSDEDASSPTEGEVGPMVVLSAEAGSLLLEPQDELPDATLDAILLGEIRWSLYDRSSEQLPSHYADWFDQRERMPADTFLRMDPLVGLSTMIAGRCWVGAIGVALIVLAVCVLIPRGFCGYVCPLGTVIDLFDWAIGRHIQRFRLRRDGWWVHTKYVILAATLLAAALGVLVSGYVAAIPVLTRAMAFIGDPLQTGLGRDWYLVPPMNWGHAVSLLLFFGILSLGLLRRRFWCAYLCPSGAIFSLSNLFRARQRKVQSTCISCGKCVQACSFDAINPDFSTRAMDCAYCKTCGKVCPTDAIVFVNRRFAVDLKPVEAGGEDSLRMGRRGFLAVSVGAAAMAGGAGSVAAVKAFGANLDSSSAKLPVRPPGSIPEEKLFQLCIRCGECFKVCPNNVLQAEGFEQGLDGLWTPRVNADWAGCEPSCNACGQICPTGAIRALPLEEKRAARMGLAVVNHETCLPWANREGCQLCVDECNAAGYHAIEFRQVHTEINDDGLPVSGTGYFAPLVLTDHCVGCGLCQTRCYAINVKAKHTISESAIVIEAGPGKEDRMMTGSYRGLREEEAMQRAEQQRSTSGPQDVEFFVPDNEPVPDNSPTVEPPSDDDDPFGIEGL